MRLSKKFAAVFGATCLTLAGLAGCSGSGDDSASDDTQESVEAGNPDEKIAEAEVGGCPVILWGDGTLEFTGDEISMADTSYANVFGDNLDLMAKIKRVKSGPLKAKGSLMQLFYHAENLTDINDLEKWDVSDVLNMSGVFDGAGITSVEALANWDTSNVTDISCMFEGTNIDVAPLANWDTSSVESTYYMFGDAKITNVDALEKWDTSSLTNVTWTFDGTGLSRDELPKWYVSKLEE